MFPVALGVVGWAAGLESALVAVVAAQMSISGAAWASTRLMGLDPYEVVGVISALGPAVSAVAGDAVRSLPAVGTAVADALATLPSCSATMLDIGAETHALREVRLFAS
jgi:urease accessory protein